MHYYDFVNSTLSALSLFSPVLNWREHNMKHNKTAVFYSIMYSMQARISRVAGIAIGVGLMGGLTPMACRG